MRMTVEELEEALDIPMPSSERLVLDDSRRLTGPGLLWAKPGAIADVLIRDFDLEDVESRWHSHVAVVLDAVGWGGEQSISRCYDGGISLAISAPMDQLYSAIFVVQASWHYTACELLDVEPEPLRRLAGQIRTVMANEARPELIALQRAAAEHGVDFIADDEAEIGRAHV